MRPAASDRASTTLPSGEVNREGPDAPVCRASLRIPSVYSNGPLAELMGWQGESPEESRRKQLEVEDLVATCMREEGWEYIPVDYAAQYPEQDESIELQQDPEAFGEKYGYGVVYNYEQWEEPSLLGEENPRDAPVITQAA